jgi:hypothetical protein
MEMKKLDTKSAAVFTNLLKEESYPHFEARSVLLGEKGTGKTTVTRTTPCYCRFTCSLFTQ